MMRTIINVKVRNFTGRDLRINGQVISAEGEAIVVHHVEDALIVTPMGTILTVEKGSRRIIDLPNQELNTIVLVNKQVYDAMKGRHNDLKMVNITGVHHR